MRISGSFILVFSRVHTFPRIMGDLLEQKGIELQSDDCIASGFSKGHTRRDGPVETRN
jgi:hypothetical protein